MAVKSRRTPTSDNLRRQSPEAECARGGEHLRGVPTLSIPVSIGPPFGGAGEREVGSFGPLAVAWAGREHRRRQGEHLSHADDQGQGSLHDVTDATTELVARARQGNRAAFTELFCLHRSDVARLIFRLVGPSPDAEDLIQEVFLQVYRSLGEFRGQAKFSTWLHSITVNVVRMSRRSARSRPAHRAPRERQRAGSCAPSGRGGGARPTHRGVSAAPGSAGGEEARRLRAARDRGSSPRRSPRCWGSR